MLITLKDSGTEAVIDSIGAQLISLKDSAGTEYIWQRDKTFWGRSSPLLFPVVGNCRNDQTVIEGRIRQINKHGFLRDAEFDVSVQSADAVTFTVSDTEETKKQYPYSYCLSLAYRLSNGCLSMEYRVENTDSRTIYYCLGAHPAFNCPLEDGARFEDYTLEFEKEETASSMTYDFEQLAYNPGHRVPRLEADRTLSLSRGFFKDDAVYFDSLISRRVSLIHRDTRRGIELSFPGFETVAFWSPYPQEAPFVCIEPWNGSGIYTTESDEFTDKNHVQRLIPGEAKSYLLRIRPIQAATGR